MQFSAFQIFHKYLNYIISGAMFVLELGQNSEIFQNLNDKVCVHNFDHLGEG